MPKNDTSPQLLLLHETAPEVCEEIGLKWSEAKALFAAKLISFNPKTSSALTETQADELRFVGSLMAVCNSTDLLKNILSSLTRPYAYSTAKIYYSWHHREWLQIPEELSLSSEVVSDYFQDLADSGELNELIGHKANVTSAIKKVRGAAVLRTQKSNKKP